MIPAGLCLGMLPTCPLLFTDSLNFTPPCLYRYNSSLYPTCSIFKAGATTFIPLFGASARAPRNFRKNCSKAETWRRIRRFVLFFSSRCARGKKEVIVIVPTGETIDGTVWKPEALIRLDKRGARWWHRKPRRTGRPPLISECSGGNETRHASYTALCRSPDGS